MILVHIIMHRMRAGLQAPLDPDSPVVSPKPCLSASLHSAGFTHRQALTSGDKNGCSSSGQSPDWPWGCLGLVPMLGPARVCMF